LQARHVPVAVQPGDGGAASLFSVDAPNIIIETVKPAEDGSGDVIVRLYEAMRTATTCALTCALPAQRVTVVNMLEEKQGVAKIKNGKVALDLRPDSPSYLKWHAEELSAERGNALFLPRGVAHGFLTLSPDAVVEYLIDMPHAADAACGARWNDPAFRIDWPAVPAVISDRDRDWPDFPNA
jgi:hypothetical protein